ncbi:MAG: CoB--CoM heterodisulfide reductase iron-sulfur subunit A family protein, partial [Armatimonadetes bacterium]|nr:CoB--CoM heterodisulfide reductase iron-sulfur subunit A family protein [Armatimonadota bacterium]
ASGPTLGHIVRPSDRKVPRRIVFIQCVGSRGEGGIPYCSRYCCMNSIKDSLLALQHEEAIEEITILHTDIRAFGKGFDRFVERARSEARIRFVRGRPAKIAEGNEASLEVFTEDTLHQALRRFPADLVVLSIGAVPTEGLSSLASLLGVECDCGGFIRKAAPEQSHTETSRKGIFVCGGAGSPQVIPDCVAQASHAAAWAAFRVPPCPLPEVPPVQPVDPSGPPRIGVFICHCGSNVAGVLNIPLLVERARALPHVAYTTSSLFACSLEGQGQIRAAVTEHSLNRIVVAACTPRTHEPIFRNALKAAGLNSFLCEMVNIRDQCSWVHYKEPTLALSRAEDQIRMGAARASRLSALSSPVISVNRKVLVIGGGISGIEAALALARLKVPVTLLEKEARPGGQLNSLSSIYPDGVESASLLREKLENLKKAEIKIFTQAGILGITGSVGDFRVEFSHPSGKKVLTAGAIILAIGGELYDADGSFGYGTLPNVVTQLELERRLQDPQSLSREVKSVTFIQCVGSRGAGNPGCSRFCCPTTVKQAIGLRSIGINATVLYRDMRMVGHKGEEFFRKAREMGVLFVPYDRTNPPTVLGEIVTVRSPLLSTDIEIPSDLTVLAVGMVPRSGDMTLLSDFLKIPRSEDGFAMEKHPELGPVETTSDGVFVCGVLQGAKDIPDSTAQAGAAAAKAFSLVRQGTITMEPLFCTVDETRCLGCGRCVEICPFHAPKLEGNGDGRLTSEIHQVLCKGCGACAVSCPTGAISPNHFTDDQIFSMIETAWR